MDSIEHTTMIEDMSKNNVTDQPVNTDNEMKIAKNSSFRTKAVNTIVLLLCCFLIGITAALMGSTYVDLQQLFQCDTRSISLVFPLFNAGVIIGSILSLFKANPLAPELSMGLSFIVFTLLSMIAPVVHSVWWFIAVNALEGFLVAVIFCDFQPYCIVLWANHRLKDPVIHAINAIWSLGVTIGPLFISPFLAQSSNTQNIEQSTAFYDTTSFPDPAAKSFQPLKLQNHSNTQQWESAVDKNPSLQQHSRDTVASDPLRTEFSELHNYTWNVGQSTLTVPHVDQQYSLAAVSSEWTLGMNTTFVPYEGNVKYAYTVIALPLLFPSIIYTIMFLKTGSSMLRKKQAVEQHTQVEGTMEGPEIVNRNALGKKQRNILLVLFITLIFFHCMLEIVPMAFLTLFVTALLDWPTPQRTLINTAYFGAVCLGRIIGTPLSAWFKPRTILAFNIAIILVASSLFLASERSDLIVWIATGLLGFGLSTVNGAMILWIAEVIRLTERIMGLMIVCSASGGIVGPFVVGQMFEAYTPMVMVYVLFGSAIIGVGLNILLWVLEARWKKNNWRENNLRVRVIESLSDVEKTIPELQDLKNNNIDHE